MTFHNEDNWPVETNTVIKIELYDSGGFAITQESGWTFGVTAEEAEGKPVPVIGEESIALGGLGSQIRGIFIGGREYRYVTRNQAEVERQNWLKDYEAKRRKEFEDNISDWLHRKNALNGPFYQRIQRFEDENFVEFWKEMGAYELFAVEQANALYDLALTKPDPVQWLNDFYDAKWEDQKILFPGLDEGHSGNTFGAMVGLARRVANGEDI